MALYTVEGEVNFRVVVEVDADTEDDAIEKAQEEIKDYYHLDVSNAYHHDDVEFIDWYGISEDDYDDYDEREDAHDS